MEPTWKLRRIGIQSAVKVGGLVSLGAGFIVGTVWAFILAFFSSLITAMMDGPIPVFHPAMVIVLPFLAALFYGVLGTMLTFLLSLLYNIAAGIVGGIEFDLGFERKEGNETFI